MILTICNGLNGKVIAGNQWIDLKLGRVCWIGGENGFTELYYRKRKLFLKELRELAAGGFPIYIYGAGFGGKQVANRLFEANIPYSGMVVDRKYKKKGGGVEHFVWKIY